MKEKEKKANYLLELSHACMYILVFKLRPLRF